MYALASLGAPPLLRGRRGTMCTAKGSDVRPGVPWGSARRGTMSTAKGSDVRPGVPWGSAAFAWQAWDNLHCQGVGCTPWRPLGLRRFCVAGVGQSALPRGWMYALASLGAPPLLRGRRGTMCTAKGSGCTPWRPLGLRLFCVAGVGQTALPRGWMYALASLGAPPLLRGRRGTMCTAKGSDVRPGVPWGSASFVWQACDNVHCQGVWMYALTSLGAPPLLRGRRGTMCSAKGSDVRPGVPWGSASFAWQAWDNVYCQGVWMYALASLGAPPLLRGRRGTICTAKGLDVRPAVPWGSAAFAWQAWDKVHCQGVGCTPWRPLGLRRFCVAGVGQCALPRGLDVRPGVPWGSAAFAWQAWDNLHCQGVGCTPWRPLGLRRFCVAGVGQGALPRGWMYALASLGAPPLLRGRRGTICTAKGSGCTPWRPLGLRLFCVAGVGQCALPRGLMYALASLGAPPLLRGRRGTMCIAKGSDVRPNVPWGSGSFA